MISRFEWFIALRYLRAKRKEGFISATALFSFIGILLGVATLIVVMSVMNGFRQELQTRILGINGHITIQSFSGEIEPYQALMDEIQPLEGVKHTIAMVDGQVMATHHNQAVGAMVRGMRLEDIHKKPILADHIVAGSLEVLEQKNSIIVGSKLALSLGVTVGDSVKLISPQGRATVIGMIPRIKTYQIGGLFEAGMHEYDSTTILMNVESAKRYFKKNSSVNLIEVTLDDAELLDDILPSIYKIAADYYVSDWKTINSSFFNALDVERSVMFLILSLIILIAAFNIISSLIMLVYDKQKSVAILRTIGATRGTMMRVFFICGASVGVVGTIAGALIGVSFANNITHIQDFIEEKTGSVLFDPVVYFLSELPSQINYNEVMAIICMSLVVSLLATLYPAFRAASIQPAQALRE